jgi:hypothetical protein
MGGYGGEGRIGQDGHGRDGASGRSVSGEIKRDRNKGRDIGNCIGSEVWGGEVRV